MATDDAAPTSHAAELSQKMTANLARLEELSARLVATLSHKREVPVELTRPGTDLYARAAGAYMTEMFTNPARLMEMQVGYWGRTLTTYLEAQQRLARGDLSAPPDAAPGDSRFASDAWRDNPFFAYLKQQYLVNGEAVMQAIDELEGLPERDRRRLRYFSEQIVNMMSPTNFLGTNPDALQRAVETEGQSLVDGLENLVRDLERNDGELLVTLADPEAFRVGENIATTPGKVVFRNRLFELIQYAPATETVHRTPLVIFPPWINKFYILDLKEKNSLIKWVVDRGITLFVVSWVNPDASYAEVGLDDYVEDGFLRAIAEVKDITGEDRVNTVGYCIGGTTLALTLALMHRRGDRSVNSATFFTTLTDFSNQGEVGVFLEDDFVDGIEREVRDKGYLDSFYMGRTFSFLRSNDLIFKPAVRSYMMGEAPPAFDLLFWNGDGTNLPARMAVDYLRGLCQSDLFATEGFQICGETVHLRDVTVPLIAIACETDHIAAWKSSFRGMQKTGSRSRTFILSESGHIAGIVNPPSKRKYGHYTNGDWSGTPEEWQAAAEFHEGSWWGRWGAWLAKRSGRQVPARIPGAGREVLADAPGTYVIGGRPD